MDCSFRGLGWIKAVNVVTDWGLPDMWDKSRLDWSENSPPKHTWAYQTSSRGIDLCSIGHACIDRAKNKTKKKCSRNSHLFHAGRSLAQVCLSAGERPDEAWHRTAGAYRHQPTTTYWPSCQTDPVRTFLSVSEKNRKSFSPLLSLAEMIIFPHTALWIIKSLFPLNTRTSHLWLCAREKKKKKAHLRSIWVHLPVVIQHLFPKVF